MRSIVVIFLLWRPRPDSRLVSVGFVLDRMEKGQVFFRFLLFSHHWHSISAPYSFSHLPLMQHNLMIISASLNNTPASHSSSFQQLLYFVSCLIAVIINSTASDFHWSVWSRFKKVCFLLFVCYILMHKMQEVKIVE
jgi:hypothetical protein